MRSIHVIQPGLSTTVQDGGRPGFGRYGVTAGGAMDDFARRVANLLVRNSEGEAVLEITLAGPTLRFEADALFSLCGGEFDVRIAGRPLRGWRPTRVRAGETLVMGGAVSGCRGYLAVAGGFDLPEVMGGWGTDLRAGVGGFHGRALKAGDELSICERIGMDTIQDRCPPRIPDGLPFWQPDWSIGTEVRPEYSPSPTIRMTRGTEFDDFTVESREAFLSFPFQVTPRSDRMGYRLDGPAIRLTRPKEYLSEAVAPGTVQVTPEGQPILLLADAPPTGGYPKIAQVARADLPVVAQCEPGDTLRFEEVGVGEARSLWLQRERQLRLIREGIRLHG